jgi:hypothetical protein
MPPGPGAPVPPPPGSKRRTPLIVGGVILVIAVVVGIVLATGGDDKKTETLGGDDTSATTAKDGGSTTTAKPGSSTSVASTATGGTTEPELVITMPPTTAPGPTEPGATTIPSDIQVATDDTKMFKVGLPKQFDTATAPIQNGSKKFSHVSGSTDLTSYANDDDTFGISVLATTTDQVATPKDFLELIGAGVSGCSDQKSGTVETDIGSAVVLRFDGCGTGGNFSKVLMSTTMPAKNAVVLVICQGKSPSDGDLFTFAKAVFNTITPV